MRISSITLMGSQTGIKGRLDARQKTMMQEPCNKPLQPQINHKRYNLLMHDFIASNALSVEQVQRVLSIVCQHLRFDPSGPATRSASMINKKRYNAIIEDLRAMQLPEKNVETILAALRNRLKFDPDDQTYNKWHLEYIHRKAAEMGVSTYAVMRSRNRKREDTKDT